MDERNEKSRGQLAHSDHRCSSAGFPFSDGTHELGGEFADADRRGGHLQ